MNESKCLTANNSEKKKSCRTSFLSWQRFALCKVSSRSIYNMIKLYIELNANQTNVASLFIIVWEYWTPHAFTLHVHVIRINACDITNQRCFKSWILLSFPFQFLLVSPIPIFPLASLVHTFLLASPMPQRLASPFPTSTGITHPHLLLALSIPISHLPYLWGRSNSDGWERQTRLQRETA